MVTRANDSTCGLQEDNATPKNDSTLYQNDIIVAVVNAPFCAWAFLSNLAIIIAVIKTTSLQKPCNILLSSLAVSDCLTGLIGQPIFIAWRLLLHQTQLSCDYQMMSFTAHLWSLRFITGWSYMSLLAISFDRHYALSKPLVYRANATAKGAIKMVMGIEIPWILFVVLSWFVITRNVRMILDTIIGIFTVVLTTVNHTRMYFSVRRQRIDMLHAVNSQQTQEILRREKKVAFSMLIVTVILLMSSLPAIIVGTLPKRFARLYRFLYPWCLTATFVNSSVNPLIFLMRNKDLRNAVKFIACNWNTCILSR